MELDILLDEYKSLTIKLIEEVNREIEIENIVESREMILNKIKSLELEGSIIKEKLVSKEIIKYEEKLFIEINKVKKSIKDELGIIKKRKIAGKQYESYQTSATFFSRKI